MRRRMIWMAPAAILGMVIFIVIGGEVVLHLWNWLLPALFGWREISFWQAIGLLALCRILFGGFGFGGGRHCSNSGGRMRGRVSERVSERMAERWEQMTPEERERFRQGLHGRGGRTTPLDSNPNA